VYQEESGHGGIYVEQKVRRGERNRGKVVGKVALVKRWM
jgi:hypothetical protein